MTFNTVPKVLYENKISEILDEIRDNYGVLTRKGYIYGLIVVDQDAKIIAIDSRFDRQLNYWDLSSIGAALYGVSRQGQDFFEADYLERAAIIFNNLQLFVKSIGDVYIEEKKCKREILIVLLADSDVNIGVITYQMKRVAPKIKFEIERSMVIQESLKMSEKELKDHIRKLKQEVFRDKISTLS
ncbi:MAG: roadblock/LC7 domain-containing protein [Candidatus Hodarchaeota archaeon]